MWHWWVFGCRQSYRFKILVHTKTITVGCTSNEIKWKCCHHCSVNAALIVCNAATDIYCCKCMCVNAAYMLVIGCDVAASKCSHRCSINVAVTVCNAPICCCYYCSCCMCVGHCMWYCYVRVFWIPWWSNRDHELNNSLMPRPRKLSNLVTWRTKAECNEGGTKALKFTKSLSSLGHGI